MELKTRQLGYGNDCSHFCSALQFTEGSLRDFLPSRPFDLLKNPLKGILSRDYYPHFTVREIEVQSALGLPQIVQTRRKKSLSLLPAFLTPDRGLFLLYLSPESLRRAAGYPGGESLEEA